VADTTAAQIEWRVYQEAVENSPLWGLTYGGVDGRFDEGFVIVYPPLTRAEITPFLLAALERGDVGLYDDDGVPERDGERDASDPGHLPRDRALKVIADPAYWNHETAPANIWLVITDAGLEQWRTMPMPEFERRPRTNY